jgi:cytochrome oxidase Cu insertion factor (SCO1/SenC/PrrC family)
LRTAVIAPDGRLFKLYRGNSWRPEQVIADIREVSSREARP